MPKINKVVTTVWYDRAHMYDLRRVFPDAQFVYVDFFDKDRLTEKTLVMEGVGYKVADWNKNQLNIAIGYSHPVIVDAPAGIEFDVPEKSGTKIVVKGIDKQLVGAIAADIRAIREPEPYHGKGIRYENEYVRRKEGKAGKK